MKSFFEGLKTTLMNLLRADAIRGYLYTWNPNDPCFDWNFGLPFGGLTFKDRSHLGSKYIYIYTHTIIYTCMRIYNNDLISGLCRHCFRQSFQTLTYNSRDSWPSESWMGLLNHNSKVGPKKLEPLYKWPTSSNGLPWGLFILLKKGVLSPQL